MKIIPAILTNDINEFNSLIVEAEKAVDRVQIDVIDGQFVDNVTIDPEVLKNIATNLNFDFHLMVKDPINWIQKCLPLEGSTKVSTTRVMGQIEFMADQNIFIDKVKSVGAVSGLAVDLETPITKIDEKVLGKIDILLLLSVKAGWFGQQFDLSIWDKIMKSIEMRKNLNLHYKIAVDGGVTKELVNEMEKLGVDELFVGKRIFEPDLAENLKLFS